MKPRHCLALAVTSILALGCASAHAQEGPGGPPPAPQDAPKRRPPAGFDAELAKKAMTEKIAAIEQRIEVIEKSDVPDKERQIGEMRRAADEMRERIAELDRGEMPDFAGGGRDPRDEQRMRETKERVGDAERRAVDAKLAIEKLTASGIGSEHPQMQQAQATLRDALAELERSRGEMDGAREGSRMRPGSFGGRRAPDGAGPHGRGAGPDDRMRGLGYAGGARGPQGPGPSVEERLAQIERAVHEMREMFERHDVPPEMRERAEREMRERRGGEPPQGFGGRAFGPGDGPGRGPGQPFDGTPRPEGADRPPVPRPPMPQSGSSGGGDVEMQLREVRDQMAAMAKQLAETQEALKKARDEIEALRAKK